MTQIVFSGRYNQQFESIFIILRFLLYRYKHLFSKIVLLLLSFEIKQVFVLYCTKRVQTTCFCCLPLKVLSNSVQRISFSLSLKGVLKL